MTFCSAASRMAQRVDDDEVRRLERRRLGAAGRQQRARHLLRVGVVHLAAQRPDVEARQDLVVGRRTPSTRGVGRGAGVAARAAPAARGRARAASSVARAHRAPVASSAASSPSPTASGTRSAGQRGSVGHRVAMVVGASGGSSPSPPASASMPLHGRGTSKRAVVRPRGRRAPSRAASRDDRPAARRPPGEWASTGDAAGRGDGLDRLAWARCPGGARTRAARGRASASNASWTRRRMAGQHQRPRDVRPAERRRAAVGASAGRTRRRSAHPARAGRRASGRSGRGAPSRWRASAAVSVASSGSTPKPRMCSSPPSRPSPWSPRAARRRRC